MTVVDEYFGGLEPGQRAAFERIRGLAVELAPQAEQGRSYGMAALTYSGKPLIGFRAAKEHLSVYPFSARVVEAVRDQLAGFELSKGTLRFTAAKPLPDKTIREIVRLRLAEIAASAS
jgi:uncharacterized protein YdhG (YjbR/CyaY superfamily)